MADKYNKSDEYFDNLTGSAEKRIPQLRLVDIYVENGRVSFQPPEKSVSLVDTMKIQAKRNDSPFGKEAAQAFLDAYLQASLATRNPNRERPESQLKAQELATYKMQQALKEVQINIEEFVNQRENINPQTNDEKQALKSENVLLNQYSSRFNLLIEKLDKLVPTNPPAMEKENDQVGKLSLEGTFALTQEKAEQLNRAADSIAAFSENKQTAEMADDYQKQKENLDFFLKNGNAEWARIGAVKTMESIESNLNELAKKGLSLAGGNNDFALKNELSDLSGALQSDSFLKVGVYEIKGGELKSGSMSDRVGSNLKSTGFSSGNESIVSLLSKKNNKDEFVIESQFEEGAKREEGMEAVRVFNQAYQGFEMAKKNSDKAWSQPVADAAVQQMRLSLSKIEENMGALAPDKGLVGGVLAYQKNVLNADDPTGSLDKAPANSADTTMKPEATPPAKMVEDKITLDPTKKEELLRDLRATFDDMREVEITRYGKTFPFDTLLTKDSTQDGRKIQGIANNDTATLQKDAIKYRDSVLMLNDALEKGNLTQAVSALDSINGALGEFSKKSSILSISSSAGKMVRYSKEMSRMIGEATGREMSNVPEYTPDNKEELLKDLGENLEAVREVEITRYGQTFTLDKHITTDINAGGRKIPGIAVNGMASLQQEGIEYRNAMVKLDKALESGNLNQAAGALEAINKSLETLNTKSSVSEIRESAGKMLEITKKMYESIEKTKKPQSREQEGAEQSSASGLPNNVKQAAMDAARPAIPSFAGVNSGRADNGELPQLVDRSKAFTRNKV